MREGHHPQHPRGLSLCVTAGVKERKIWDGNLKGQGHLQPCTRSFRATLSCSAPWDSPALSQTPIKQRAIFPRSAPWKVPL